MNNLNYMTLYFEVQENTNISTDLEPAVTAEHVDRLTDNINTLVEVMGISDPMPMAAGSTIKRYKTTVTKGGKQAEEGDIIPLSKVERKEADPIVLELNTYRKLTTAQAIQRVGVERALVKTDGALVREVQKDIRNAFFATLTAEGSTAAKAGANLQDAMAQCWAGVAKYFDDVDAGGSIAFISPDDLADYQGTHQITTEEAFGLRYLVNFMNFDVVFTTPRIPAGAVYGTVANNLNVAYIPQNGEVGDAFQMTADESGLVGMTHSRADDRASIQTLIMSGVTFYTEDASGVIKSTIGE